MYQILPMNTLVASITVSLTLVSLFTIVTFWYSFKGSKEKMYTYTKKIVELNKKLLSLFLSFDPKSSPQVIMKEMNWLVPMIFILFVFLSLWLKPSRVYTMMGNFINFFTQQFEIALKSKKDSSKLMFVSLFMFIGLANMSGLIPNSFTLTSHLTTNLFLSVPMWTGFLLFGWWTFTNKMLAHLVPNGTPTALISFMVFIELISTSIRPFTLSIRLMANMVSGHLLLTLLGNTMISVSVTLVIVMVSIQTLLVILELGVCLIQAYVFCMLLALYSDESEYTS